MANLNVDLVVLGSGPGGYAAAFRAADLGLSVALVEKHKTLGGVCLNVGCIPSKALLHVAEIINSNKEMAEMGVDLGAKSNFNAIDLLKMKNGIIKKLTQGLSGLASLRKVKVVEGVGVFSGENEVTITNGDKTEVISLKTLLLQLALSL